jgi:hypothetical protein
MDKGYILNWRKSMSPEDRQTFDRWLRRNVLAGAIFMAGLLAMSFLGSQRGTTPDDALAGRPSTDVVATVTPK